MSRVGQVMDFYRKREAGGGGGGAGAGGGAGGAGGGGGGSVNALGDVPTGRLLRRRRQPLVRKKNADNTGAGSALALIGAEAVVTAEDVLQAARGDRED